MFELENKKIDEKKFMILKQHEKYMAQLEIIRINKEIQIKNEQELHERKMAFLDLLLKEKLTQIKNMTLLL